MDFVVGTITLLTTQTHTSFDTSWNFRVPGNFPVLGSCPSQPRRRHYGAKGWTGSPQGPQVRYVRDLYSLQSDIYCIVPTGSMGKSTSMGVL